jgi:Ca-activated chloride channel family protein
VSSSSDGSPIVAALAGVAVGVTMAVVAAVVVVNRSRSDPLPVGPGRTCTPIVVNTSTEKVDLVNDLAGRYARAALAGARPGRCAEIAVEQTSSGEATNYIARDEWAGGRAPNNTRAPDVWLPSTSLWIDQLGDDPPVVRRPDGRFSYLGQSPLVFAMRRDMADALGLPVPSLSWKKVRELVEDEDAWKRRGHADWGRFSLGKDSPETSSSGLLSTVAEFAAAKGNETDLTSADLASAANKGFVRAVDGSLGKQAIDDATQFMRDLRDEYDRGNLKFVSAVAIQEEMVFLYNEGRIPAGRDAQGRPVPPKPPPPDDEKLVALALDHPFVLMDRAGAAEREAARDFESFLLEPAQQESFRDYGFRGERKEATGPLRRVLAGLAAAPPKELPRPSGAFLTEMRQQWKDLRQPLQLLVALDCSGTMAVRDDLNGRTRIENLRAAVNRGLSLLSGDDEVELWTFPRWVDDQQPPQCSTSLKETVSHSPLFGHERLGTDARRRVQAKVEAIQPTGERSPLLRTVVEAQERMKELVWQGPRAIIVISDGEDEDYEPFKGRLTPDDLPRGPVQVWAIAYGATPDGRVTMHEIAERTDVPADKLRDGLDIDTAFVGVLTSLKRDD